MNVCNSSTSWIVWGWVHFQQMFICGLINYSFNCIQKLSLTPGSPFLHSNRQGNRTSLRVYGIVGTSVCWWVFWVGCKQLGPWVTIRYASPRINYLPHFCASLINWAVQLIHLPPRPKGLFYLHPNSASYFMMHMAFQKESEFDCAMFVLDAYLSYLPKHNLYLFICILCKGWLNWLFMLRFCTAAHQFYLWTPQREP